jgi:ATP phosphoribosyltransferase
MSRCYICDTILQPHEIILVDGSTEPCSKCNSMVNDIVQEDTTLYESQLEEFEQYAVE